MIDIRVSLSGKKITAQATTALTADDASGIINQVVRDSAVGSFGEFPPFWKERWEVDDQFYARREEKIENLGDRFSFILKLNERLFPPDRGGLQHLTGILLGDVFRPRIPGYEVSFVVDQVSLSRDYLDRTVTIFRQNRANTIEDIRQQFQLWR